jgi:hypothetical protein
MVPVQLYLNRRALDGLHEQWRIPDEVAKRADVLFDAAGRHVRAP